MFIIMKNPVLFSMLLFCIGIKSCKKNESQKKEETIKAQAEKPISVECYKALYEKDTIELKVNNLNGGKVSGNMVMKINDFPKRVGEIKGKFHGDTLFV